tara:strand:+ start:210 stop:428 length:219 start_codon:yes stop_codon:yes gene_type:complete
VKESFLLSACGLAVSYQIEKIESLVSPHRGDLRSREPIHLMKTDLDRPESTDFRIEPGSANGWEYSPMAIVV